MIQALLEAEVLRRAGVESIVDRASSSRTRSLDKDGNVVGVRLSAHPLFDHVRRLYGVLGLTDEDMQLTKKSRGQGLKDAAIAAALAHAALRRAADKRRSRRRRARTSRSTWLRWQALRPNPHPKGVGVSELRRPNVVWTEARWMQVVADATTW